MVTPVVKNLQCRRCRFDPWVRKISRSRKWQPTPVFLPGKFHGQKGLVSYSARGHKVRYDWMTEHAPNSMVTDGNYIFGGIHAIMYTKVEVYCCTHETYYVISHCYFNEKELKRKFFFFSKEKQRQISTSQTLEHWHQWCTLPERSIWRSRWKPSLPFPTTLWNGHWQWELLRERAILTPWWISFFDFNLCFLLLACLMNGQLLTSTLVFQECKNQKWHRKL